MGKTANELLGTYETAIVQGRGERRLKALSELSEALWELEFSRLSTGRAPTEWNETALVRLAPSLVSCIHDSDKAAEHAMSVLKRLQPAGLEALLVLLEAPDRDIRLRVCEGLRHWGDKALPACPALRRVTTDEDSKVSSLAFLAIGLTHEASHENFRACLEGARSPVPDVRSYAIHALGNLGMAKATDWSAATRDQWVDTWLKDDDAAVRRSALHVLESDGQSEKARAKAVQDLLRIEKDEEVLERAVGLLKDLSPNDFSDQDIDLLCQHLPRTSRVADGIAEFLVRCPERSQSAIPVLRNLMLSESCACIRSLATAYWRISGDANTTVVAMQIHFDDNPEAVCDALCELGPAGIALVPKLLEAMASDDWDLQWAAADALGKVADASKESLDALVQALAHDSPIVRSAAARALASVGAPALPRLIAALSGEPFTARSWAAYALSEMGEAASPAIEALNEVIRSESEGLRLWVTVALANITKDVEWVEPLADLLMLDPGDYDLATVCESLSNYGRLASSAIPDLEHLARVGDERQSEAANEALQRISGPLN